MILHLELESGRERATGALAAPRPVNRPELLEAGPAEPLALARIEVEAGVVVPFEVGAAPLRGRARGEVESRALEVEVAQRRGARGDPLLAHQRVDVLGSGHPAGLEPEGELRPAGKRDVGAGAVAQHHDVPVLPMLEEVEDALLLEEPLREGEVGLAVLDAEVAGRVAALDRPALLHLPGVEDLLRDLGDGDVLEDAAAAHALEALELRDEAPPAGRPARAICDELHAVQEPVHESVWQVGRAHGEEGLGAHEFGDLDRLVVVTAKIELERERLRERLSPADARDRDVRRGEGAGFKVEGGSAALTHVGRSGMLVWRSGELLHVRDLRGKVEGQGTDAVVSARAVSRLSSA